MADRQYYIDISKIGKDLTGDRDISVYFNENAVVEAVKNLLFTKKTTRIMNPQFGIDIEQYLFEMIDDITAIQIRKAIEDGITRYEPRVENLAVIVEADIDNNIYDVTIQFNTKIVQRQQTLQFQLEKIR